MHTILVHVHVMHMHAVVSSDLVSLVLLSVFRLRANSLACTCDDFGVHDVRFALCVLNCGDVCKVTFVMATSKQYNVYESSCVCVQGMSGKLSSL